MASFRLESGQWVRCGVVAEWVRPSRVANQKGGVGKTTTVGQRRGFPRTRRAPGPHRRSRCPGQRHQRPRHRPVAARGIGLRHPARRPPGRRRHPSDGPRGPGHRALGPGPGRRRGGARPSPKPRTPTASGPVADRRRLRLRVPRLPSFSWSAHGQCAHGGRFGAHPAPMRVLRPRGPQPADGDAGPRARASEPRPVPERCRADDVRRSHGARGRRRRRGAFATSAIASSRRSCPAACGSPRHPASAGRSSCTARLTRSPGLPRRSRRSS